MAERKKTLHPDEQKLRELIVYLASLSEPGDEFWGAIKLNKLLFYIDFVAYRRFGKSVTGQEYQCQRLGPTPRKLPPLITKMKQAGDIREKRVMFHGREQIRTVALRRANKEMFAKDEIDLIHETVSRFWKMSASEISEESHTFLGWKVAEIGETIPYGMVLIGNRKPTEKEAKLGKRLQKLAGEALTRSGR
jgi:hypothetical protein